MEQILLEVMSKHLEDVEVDRISQHGFTKTKLFLGSLLALYNGVTAILDKERVMDVICLDPCKVFYMVSHNILATNLERY